MDTGSSMMADKFSYPNLNNTKGIEVDDLNSIMVHKQIPNSVLMGLFLLLGISGNSIVLLVYKRQMKEIKKERFFIPLLSAADLCACVFGSIFSILQNTFSLNFSWSILCKLLYFLTWTSMCTSVLFLMVIVIVRYRKVCLGKLRVSWRYLTTGIVIGVSVIICAPQLYFTGTEKFLISDKEMKVIAESCNVLQMDGLFKYLSLAYNLIIVLIVLCVAVTMVTLYSFIGAVVYRRLASTKKLKHTMEVASIGNTRRNAVAVDTENMLETSTSENNNEKDNIIKRQSMDIRPTLNDVNLPQRLKRRRARRNFTRMFLMIVIFFLVSYIPTQISLFIGSHFTTETLQKLNGLEINGLLFVRRLFLANHIVNPFIYTFYDLTFREKLKELFCLKKT